MARHGQPEVRTVYIDLLECGDEWEGHDFDLVLEIGPFEPGRYSIQVHDSIRHVVSPPPPALDTAELTIHRRGDVKASVPGVSTDAAAFDVELSGLLGFTNCVVLGAGDPDLQRRVVELGWSCASVEKPIERFEATVEAGPLPAGDWEIRFFEFREISPGPGDPPPAPMSRARFTVHDADRCVPSDTVLCLRDGRFRAEVEWTDFEGDVGDGHAVPMAEGGETTGGFWFFREGNLELMLKVLDGCPVNGHWWAFTTSATNVGYHLTVTDTATGHSKSYGNDVGVVPMLRADTVFEACSAD